MNTCFQKKKSGLMTFRSGETETMINYILVNNKYRSSVKGCESNPRWWDRESTLSSADGYGVQKGQEENKILKEIETVEVERVRGERRVCSRGQQLMWW